MQCLRSIFILCATVLFFLSILVFALIKKIKPESQFQILNRMFSPGILVSSTNKTDRHDITKKILKVALNTINQIKSTNQLLNSLITATIFFFFFFLQCVRKMNHIEVHVQFRSKIKIQQKTQDKIHIIIYITFFPSINLYTGENNYRGISSLKKYKH